MNVEKEILELIKKYAPEDMGTIDLKMSLVNDLLMDSLQIVSVLVDLEQKFEIELELEDISLDIIHDVNGLVTLVKRYKHII